MIDKPEYKRYRTHVQLMFNRIKQGSKINPAYEINQTIKEIEKEYNCKLDFNICTAIDNSVIYDNSVLY